MDSFFEQIVVKKKGTKEWLVITATVLGGLILAFLAWMLQFAFVLVLVGVVYGGWWLITTQNIEYEYCVTNGDIDVDQITARRKRKRLVSVSGRKVESLLPFDPAAPMGKYQRTVMVAPSLQESGLWYFTYHSKKNGHTLVVFQPDERVLQALYVGLPKLVQMDTRRAAQNVGIELNHQASHGA